MIKDELPFFNRNFAQKSDWLWLDLDRFSPDGDHGLELEHLCKALCGESPRGLACLTFHTQLGLVRTAAIHATRTLEGGRAHPDLPREDYSVATLIAIALCESRLLRVVRFPTSTDHKDHKDLRRGPSAQDGAGHDTSGVGLLPLRALQVCSANICVPLKVVIRRAVHTKKD